MDGASIELDAILQRGFRYAVALTHDREEARDLVQDGCVRVLRAGRTWSVGYLLSAIRSAWIDRGRRQHPASPCEDSLVPADPVFDPEVAPDDSLDAALRVLGAEDRELLFLAAVEGYTASELAKQTG